MRLDLGIWDLILGIWDFVLGIWDLVLGTWNLVPGIWDLVLGTWNLVPGTFSPFRIRIFCFVKFERIQHYSRGQFFLQLITNIYQQVFSRRFCCPANQVLMSIQPWIIEKISLG